MIDENTAISPEAAGLSSDKFDLNGRSVGGGSGIDWLSRGWGLFAKNPGIWLAITVILIVIMIFSNVIPFLGQLMGQVLMPVFIGGVLLGCKSLDEGGELRVEHLFAGFEKNAGNLIMIGVFNLIAVIVVVVLTFVVAGGAALTGGLMGHSTGAGVAFGGVMLAVLMMLVLMVPIWMAMYFAPALVIFRNVPPLDAMKKSFGACLKNIVPFLLYGIVLFVLSIVAIIPIGLGFLILLPVILASMYCSYKDVFE